MKRLLYIVCAIALCVAVGLTASYFQSESIHTWYPGLQKPSLTPPDWAFPVAWGFIYLCMGISVGWVWNRSRSPIGWMVTLLFVLQLFLNFLWSFLFFYLRNPLLGGVDILLLDLTVLAYIFCVWRESRLSAILFVPYLLWLLFATRLNAYIVIYN